MSVGTTKGERRRKSRKRPLTLVYVELASANGGMMRDLSEEGFAVRAMMPVKAGENTPFVFSLSEKVRIEGRGLIHWVQEDGHVAGVRFLDLPAGAREQIREWLIRPETPPKREAVAKAKEITLEELREEIHAVPPRGKSKPSGEATVSSNAVVPAKRPVATDRVAPVTPVEARPSVSAQVKPPVEVHAKTVEHEPEIERAKEPLAVPESSPMPATPDIVAREPDVVVPTAAKEPEAVAPVVLKTPDVVMPPVAPVPVAPVHEESPRAPSGVVVPPREKPLEPTIPREPETKRESIFEEPEAPALPKLSLFPRVTDTEYPPATPRLTTSQEMAAKQQRKAMLPVEAAPVSETKAPEVQLVLPDISTVLIQPHGGVQRPAPPIPVVETVASWQPESAPGESWSERFSLTKAITLMSIVAMLVSLYVFHRNVGQGLIWLGKKMGGRQQSSASATLLEQPGTQQADTTTKQLEQAPQFANTAAPERHAGNETDSAAKDPAAAPAAPPSEPAPAISSSSETGQNEYLQAMQLQRTKGVAATPEILRLLWIAVEKGNANAELALAEMYWQGQGVTRNCDQAHILLTAAARKGSAEAQKRLVEFQRAGCE